MDFGKDEADMIREDRVGDPDSCNQNEESEDEDNQQELEVMLYSHVYFDDSNFKEPKNSPEGSSNVEPSVKVKPVAVGSNEPKPTNPQSTLHSTATSSLPLQQSPNCLPSQFNHPDRTRASRYYDVNHSRSIAQSTFLAPRKPFQKQNTNVLGVSKPTELTSRLMARSVNETSYLPSSSKQKQPVPKDAQSDHPKETLPESKSVANSVEANALPCEQNEGKGVASSCTHDVSGSGQLSAPHTIEDSSVDKSNCPAKDQNSQQMSPPNSAKASRQQSFEAKAAKVLSSMLDEESRSSCDDTHFISTCANQNLRDLNSDASWSIGMSWADMSSNRFEADIEEESVSSLQLQEGCAATDSRTVTPESSHHLEAEKDSEEPSEPSRYNLNLRAPSNQDSEKGGSGIEANSETGSDVDSVVEVAPPVKPVPVLVDIADLEDVATPSSTGRKLSKKGRYSTEEITVLFTKSKDPSVESEKQVIEHVINSSDDDDILILSEVDTSKSSHISIDKQSTRVEEHSTMSSGNSPRKRHLASNDNNDLMYEEQLLKKGRDLLQNPSPTPYQEKMAKLDRKLYNTRKAFKSFDHELLLQKMSDNPNLWKMCRADRGETYGSPRGPKCINCNQFGHKTQFCTEPKKIVSCHMCGASGHSETRCPQKMCLKCGRKNNIFTDRCKECASPNEDPCRICKSDAHEWKACPDLWRRYHLTVSAGEITKPLGDDLLPKQKHWCSNCAGNGHLSHECLKSQWKCESINPFIVSYTSIEDEAKKIDTISKGAVLLTPKDVTLLSSLEGRKFLHELSNEMNVAIHTSFDIPFKKIVFEGTSLGLEEVRAKLKQWIQENGAKKVQKLAIQLLPDEVVLLSSAKGHLFLKRLSRQSRVVFPTNFDSSNNTIFVEGNVKELRKAQNKIRCWFRTEKKMKKMLEDLKAGSKTVLVELSRGFKLPKQSKKLATFLDDELKLLNSAHVKNVNVRQIYDRMCSLGTDYKDSLTEKFRCARLLSMKLLGQCGYAGGHDLIQQIKKLIEILYKMGKTYSGDLYLKAQELYCPIFAGGIREDFESLVDKFYMDHIQSNEKVESQTSENQPLTVERKRKSAAKKQIRILKRGELRLKRNLSVLKEDLKSRFIKCSDVNYLDKNLQIYYKSNRNLTVLRALQERCDSLCREYRVKV